ncbi:MAG TPA: ATP-binding cassette domain-containing protein [Aeromonadales bacterium]|nr:ATP-binding cassette domain-containing protein [Aeromonadales bacterium]
MLNCQFTLATDEASTHTPLSANFSWSGNGILGISGPSGGGKTTLLNILAGFPPENLTQTALSWDENILHNSAQNNFMTAEKRPISMVFQQQTLFPHITVKQNLQFARKHGYRKLPEQQFRALINSFDLEDLLSKSPEQLSGGEKNRVALVQSLCALPELLLLDEPFSALDSAKQHETIATLKKCVKRLNISVILVSHSFHELAYMCDEILFIKQHIVTGPFSDVINQLNINRYTSNHVEPLTTFLAAKLCHYHEDEQQAEFEIDGDKVLISCSHYPEQIENIEIPAHEVSILLKPAKGTSIANCLAVVLSDYQQSGGEIVLTLTLKKQSLYCKITKKSFNQLNLHKGLSLYAQFKATAIHIF